MMDEDMLTDGPFCPDSTSASRFDADLLRIRKIGVVLRVQVPSSELRGPAGALFRNAAAFGVDAGLAVVAVLVFRAFTFWLPLIPGVIAFFKLRGTVERWKRGATIQSKA